MADEICKHGLHAPVVMLKGLHDSQGGLGRHKCTVCSYELGRQDSTRKITDLGQFIKCDHGNAAPKSILEDLGESQAGHGRHKCVVCAYQYGRASISDVSLDNAWLIDDNPETSSLIENGDDVPPPAMTHEFVPESRLKEIGLAGENLVMEYEKQRLISLGKVALANRVTHVSVDEGDHIGYDIRSYTEIGEEMFIEVKTTVSGISTPFYLSRNEYKFSGEHADNYYVYRLYDLNEVDHRAKFYKKRGNVNDNFSLETDVYRVSPK